MRWFLSLVLAVCPPQVGPPPSDQAPPLAPAIEEARASGDRVKEATLLLKLGAQLHEARDYVGARRAYERCVAIGEEVDTGIVHARALSNFGVVHLDLGDLVAARPLLERSAERARELGASKYEGMALGNLGLTLARLGELDEARRHLERRLEIARELGDAKGESAAYANLAFVLDRLGRFEEAEELIEQYLELARRLEEPAYEASALRDLGSMAWKRGDFSRARERFEEALGISERIDDRVSVALARSGLGVICWSVGAFAEAREHHRAHLDTSLQLGDRLGVSVALGNLGLVCDGLGDFEAARSFHEQHRVLSRELGDREGEARALANLGNASRGLGRYEEALDYHRQHLALARELGDPSGEAAALVNSASSLVALKRPDEATPLAEQALALHRELGQRAREAATLSILADARFEARDPEAAAELATRAIDLFATLGAEDESLTAHVTRTRSALALADRAQAWEDLRRARALFERRSGHAGSPAEGMALRSHWSQLAELTQALTHAELAAAGDDGAQRTPVVEAGFREEGAWKGRALLEGIAEHRVGARSAEAIALKRERREVLARRAATLREIPAAIQGGASSAEVAELRDRAATFLRQAARLEDELLAVSPRDATLDLPRGVSFDDVRREVLDAQTMLVEYARGPKGLYVYALTGADCFFARVGARAELADRVSEFLSLVASPASPGAPAAVVDVGRDLFDRLLAAPLRAVGADVERLLIVPTASLAALPFEALVLSATEDAGFAGAEFVIDRYEVSYGPSSPVLVELTSYGPRRTSGRVLILADPLYPDERDARQALADAEGAAGGGGTSLLGPARSPPSRDRLVRLPKTRHEAMALAQRLLADDEIAAAAALSRLAPERSGALDAELFELRLGAEATPTVLSDALRAYSVVHLAAHGFIDGEDPRLSGVALSAAGDDDGMFTIEDALELDLDANLVVLSACDTARGEVRSGEGVQSVARAFLYAGARSVVASLWEVADWAAADTMVAFYEAALDEGLTPSRALRRAKLALRRSSGVRGVSLATDDGAPVVGADHPCFWAPFIHIGRAR